MVFMDYIIVCGKCLYYLPLISKEFPKATFENFLKQY